MAKSSAEIRREVTEAYAAAVTSPTTRTCCSGPTPKGVTAKLAGYTRDELAALPADAVVNSFGCGNPLAFAEVKEGETVLDLGAGAGIDVLLAAAKVGPSGRAIGVDMTDEMIARAKENIAAAGVANAEVRKGLIEDLPVESESVDWVISNCVINLSPEKDRVFAEIARVLRPGGRMVVSDIVVDDLPESVRANAACYSACVAGAISEAEYIEGLRRAGLVDVEVQERLLYDASQIAAFVESETCCGLAGTNELGGIADSLAGKVWSAKFHARKPSACLSARAASSPSRGG